MLFFARTDGNNPKTFVSESIQNDPEMNKLVDRLNDLWLIQRYEPDAPAHLALARELDRAIEVNERLQKANEQLVVDLQQVTTRLKQSVEQLSSYTSEFNGGSVRKKNKHK